MPLSARWLFYASTVLMAMGVGLMVTGGVLISTRYGFSAEYIAANIGAFCGLGQMPPQLISLGDYSAEIYTYPPLPSRGEEVSLNFVVKDPEGRYAEDLRYNVQIIETAAIDDVRLDLLQIHQSGEEGCRYGSCVYRYSFNQDGVYRLAIEISHGSRKYLASFYITVFEGAYLAMFPTGLYLISLGGIMAAIAAISRILSHGAA